MTYLCPPDRCRGQEFWPQGNGESECSTHPWGQGFSPSLSREAAESSECSLQGPRPGWPLGQTLAPGLVFLVTAVIHAAIAAVPLKSMKQLIWFHGLEKMKYDRVATALQRPRASQPFRMMNKLSKLHLRVIITGNAAGPALHINHAKKPTQWSLS